MATAGQVKSTAILGYFMFKDLGDSCLGSKFSNTINKRLFAEAAVRKRDTEKGHDDNYIGTYETCWLDESSVPNSGNQAILCIYRKHDSLGGQYALTWYNPNNLKIIYYHGEGMLCDGNLVGCYWDRSIQEVLENTRS